MDHVGGIADQAPADRRRTSAQPTARPESRGAARPPRYRPGAGRTGAPARHGTHRRAAQRCASASRVSSVHTIDERLPLERQNRERAARQEVLLGAAVMVALVPHRGDDRGLAVAPAEGLDAGELAQTRARAVGRDQNARRHRRTVVEPRHNALALRVERRDGGARAASHPRHPPWRAARREDRGSRSCGRTARPASISPSNVRNTGRTASATRLSVIAMSRIGCASSACHTPSVSNSRRAAAAIAVARVSAWACASAGSATVTRNEGPSAWRNAIASERPAKPPPPIRTSQCRADG